MRAFLLGTQSTSVLQKSLDTRILFSHVQGGEIQRRCLGPVIQASRSAICCPGAQHHENFAMWDSDVTPFNAVKMGPKRDVIGELAKTRSALAQVSIAESVLTERMHPSHHNLSMLQLHFKTTGLFRRSESATRRAFPHPL